VEITNDSRRFHAIEDDQVVGWLDYVEDGEVASFTHTEVLREFTGRGIAASLVFRALEYAADRGWSVLPYCSYVKEYIASHTEYLHLVPVEQRPGFGLEIRIADLEVGTRFASVESIEVRAEEIMAFAKAYDPQPGHLSEESALNSPFHSLAASGWHTAAISMKLLIGMGFMGAIGASVTLTWPTPTRPGDRLRIDGRVTAMRESKTKPGQRVIHIEYETLNQDGEVRQRTETVLITPLPTLSIP